MGRMTTALTPAFQLSLAIKIASDAFHGITDKGGEPYILHCLKVMDYLHSDDFELRAAAVLHDIIEDTNMTYAKLKQLGFSDRVIKIVRGMTKIPGQSHEEYMEQLKEPDVVKVKLADNRHNSDIRRLKGVTQKDFDRIAKYMQIRVELIAYQKTLEEHS